MIVEIKKKKKRKEKEKISNKCYRKIRILIRNNELKIVWRKLFSSLFFIVSNHIFIQEKYWIAHLLYYLCLIKDSRHNINVTCEKQLLFLTTTCIPISNPFLNIKLRCWINLSNLYLFNKWKIAIAIYSLSYFFFLLNNYFTIIISFRVFIDIVHSFFAYLFTFYSKYFHNSNNLGKIFSHSIGRRPLRSKCNSMM